MLSTKQNFSIGILEIQMPLRLWMLFTVWTIILGCSLKAALVILSA